MKELKKEIDSILDIPVCLIKDKRIVYSNRKAEEFFGYKVEEVINIPYTVFLPANEIEFAEILHNNRRNILLEEFSNGIWDTYVLTKDGKPEKITVRTVRKITKEGVYVIAYIKAHEIDIFKKINDDYIIEKDRNLLYIKMKKVVSERSRLAEQRILCIINNHVGKQWDKEISLYKLEDGEFLIELKNHHLAETLTEILNKDSFFKRKRKKILHLKFNKHMSLKEIKNHIKILDSFLISSPPDQVKNVTNITEQKYKNEIRKIKQKILKLDFFNNENVIYNMNTGKNYGLELTLKMQSLTESFTDTNYIIDLMNMEGLLNTLVIKQLEKYRKRKEKIFINIHPFQLIDDDIFSDLLKKLDEITIDSDIVFEITEQKNICIDKNYLEKLQELKQRKIKLAIDDFGAEISRYSIDHLFLLPVDYVKLDKILTQKIDNKTTIFYIESIMETTDKLNMNIIAEGIETQEQSRIMFDLGIYLQQGYLFSSGGTQEEIFEK